MKARTALLLVVLAAAVLAAGLYFGTGNREQVASIPQSQFAFPNLAQRLQDAGRIEVLHHGTTLVLTRSGNVWTLPARSGYPADQGKVHALTAQLTELKLDEPRTSNADDYARLGVEDAQGKDADSTLIRILDGAGAPLAEVIAGHQRTGNHGGGDGTYLRRSGESQTWLAAGRLSASTEAMDWIDPIIADVPPPDVTSVAVTRAGLTMNIARQDGHMVMTAPAEHPKLDQFKLEDMARGLERLTLTDVKPAPAPGKPLGVAVVSLKSGMSVTVDVSLDGSDTWLTLPSAQGEGAAALMARTKGWAYRVGEWKQQALVPSMDELKAYQPAPGEAGKTPDPAAVPLNGIPGLSIVPPTPKSGG